MRDVAGSHLLSPELSSYKKSRSPKLNHFWMTMKHKSVNLIWGRSLCHKMKNDNSKAVQHSIFIANCTTQCKSASKTTSKCSLTELLNNFPSYSHRNFPKMNYKFIGAPSFVSRLQDPLITSQQPFFRPDRNYRTCVLAYIQKP